MKTQSTARGGAATAIPGLGALRLGDVEVLPASGLIRGPAGERKLDPKVMAVLLRLAAAEGNVVSREALLADVWGGVVVTDFALSRCIYQLRKNLGSVSERRDSPIGTLPKRGYSLTWPVEASETSREIGWTGVGPRWLAATAFILLVAGILLWHDWAPDTSTEARPAIAVMPFEDLTTDGSLGHFGDGVAQTLLAELGHAKEMDVIARGSSFSLRSANMRPDDLAHALGVRYLVEGSVNREAETLHVSAVLIDARDGRQVWSKDFQRVARQSSSVQQDIAAEIVGYLQVSLGDPHGHGGTNSFEAFEAYLRALATDDPEVAGVFIDEALAHDGNFALALVYKAQLAYAQTWQGIGTAEGSWEEARPLLEKALSITDELPDAYVLIGGFQMQREDYTAAEPALRRALEISPSHNEAFAHLSRLLARTGRFHEAVILAERNVRLDPLNSARHAQLANRLWTAGDIQGATEGFERALELDPYNHNAWGDYAHRLGDLEGHLESFRLVARWQRDPQFRSLFYGPTPKLPPASVQLFGLWFGFIEDFEREREMLELQSHMANNARLHRELAWALIGERNLEGARREAWIGLRGMPRESIANFQVAYIALQTDRDHDAVMDHFRTQWPGMFLEPPEPDAIPAGILIGAALLHRRLGDEQRAVRLLRLLQEDREDPFAASAMALAHLGDTDGAITALAKHIDEGGYFSYVVGDPFWAPLSEDARFMAIVEAHHAAASASREKVRAMIESGELVVPGQLEHHASRQSAARR